MNCQVNFMINGISGNEYGGYSYYGNYKNENKAGGNYSNGYNSDVNDINGKDNKVNNADEGKSVEQEKAAKRMGLEECETCKNRKYQDGSDENVSFKSAAHISPEAAASAVRGHEQEHVSNAYDKAAQNNGKVVNASVTIHTSICPECGRSYVSGGETVTQTMYKEENNKYNNDPEKLLGNNFDAAT